VIAFITFLLRCPTVLAGRRGGSVGFVFTVAIVPTLGRGRAQRCAVT
jgi:hypothetical protein